MTNNAEAVITVDQLRKNYRSGLFGRGVEALRGVTFQVGRGEIFGLLGPNGAGKTTIIKVLLGIVRRSGGTATLLNHPAGDRRGRRQVGYLPEDLSFPRYQTARTALEYYGRLSGLSFHDIGVRRDRLLDAVGLAGRDRESLKRYSKGMLQRLGLAQALLHEPRVLILDEPTDGLDPVGRSQVRNLLQQLRNEGRTVFLNSHLLQEVELVCDRVAIIDNGQLRFEGTIDQLTPDQDKELQLHLVGSEPAIRASLDGHTVEKWEPVGSEQIRVVVPVSSQADSDRLVDSLRRQNVSIASLTWRRKTLEDAFLELVAKTGEHA
jgi:ABC-2 type transport system ATP-binding protein